jgi:hypothetical protein
MQNWTFDLAVESAKYVNDDPKQGVAIVVSNLHQLVLPETLQVEYRDGTKARLRIPVEAWLSKGAGTFILKEGKPVATVTVDPDHVLPDDDRSNNVFKMR